MSAIIDPRKPREAKEKSPKKARETKKDPPNPDEVRKVCKKLDEVKKTPSKPGAAKEKAPKKGSKAKKFPLPNQTRPQRSLLVLLGSAGNPRSKLQQPRC